MLNSFKEFFTLNQIKKVFINSKLNKKKEIMKIDKLQPLFKFLKDQDNLKNLQQLLKQIYSKLQSKNTVQKLKTLIMLHYLLRQNFSQIIKNVVLNKLTVNFDQFIIQTKTKNNKSYQIQIYSQKYIQQYIEKFIILDYKLYLQKICFKEQAIKFAKEFQPESVKNYTMVQVISNGFQIINLCQIILKTQESFNKMGSLFMIYLDDLKAFNTFIKNIAKVLVKNPQQNNSEQIRHNFMFLTESQKISDKLSQFFLNRYYFPWTQKIYQMPKFMTINCQSFDKVRNSAKKIDIEMVKLVKKSSQNSSFIWKNKSEVRGLQNVSINKSTCIQSLAKTIGIYHQSKKVKSSNERLNHFAKIHLPDLQFLQQNQQQHTNDESEQQNYGQNINEAKVVV